MRKIKSNIEEKTTYTLSDLKIGDVILDEDGDVLIYTNSGEFVVLCASDGMATGEIFQRHDIAGSFTLLDDAGVHSRHF